MGILHQNRKGVSAEIKSAKLKKGEHVSVCKDRLMEMEVGEEGIVLLSTTHDKIVPTWVLGNDMEKSKVVIGYDSGMGGAMLT
jgi:hypothetical protein